MSLTFALVNKLVEFITKSVQNQAIMTQDAVKNNMECEIIWDYLSECAYHAHYLSVKRANLLQSLDYVRVMALQNHQYIRRGLIMIDGVEAGIFQTLEAGLVKNAIHGVILDGGPLWFDGFGGLRDFSAFMERFSARYPKRFGRRTRVLPNLENSKLLATRMSELGYKPMSKGGYQTIWIDTRSDMDRLRANLKGGWRGALRKAEKTGIEVSWSDTGKYFSWLMKQYAQDKKNKGYDGPSPKIMTALAEEFSRGKNMLIGVALLDGHPIAAILLLEHGHSATYQIGYSSDKGRECAAHHLLLWRALGQLKERQIYDFDLGGVNAEHAKGVKIFKEGLGGTLVETAGVYCS